MTLAEGGAEHNMRMDSKREVMEGDMRLKLRENICIFLHVFVYEE